MKSNRFYLACFRDNVGSNVSFHRKNGSGYSTDLDQAHIFTREEAQFEWEHCREFEQPLCADRIDALAEWHVDFQRLPTSEDTMLVDGCKAYVAYQAKSWNGNDVYWLSNGRMPTCNFKLATIFPEPIDTKDHDVIWVPFEIADKAKRRTIDINKINPRSMCQAAGLITPKRVKRQHRRHDSGKTRWNCPSCGRISWQYNPSFFEGCSNINCDKWTPAYERGAA